MSQVSSRPPLGSKCRHCRAPNEPDAWECWLCSRRDWRGALVVRPGDPEPAPPRHSPHRTTAGLPGLSGCRMIESVRLISIVLIVALSIIMPLIFKAVAP